MTLSSLRFPLLAAGLAIASPFVGSAQNLPDEYYISNDGLRLVAGGTAANGFFDEEDVHAIYLTFSQANYWTLLQNNYDSGTPILAALTYDGVTYDSVGVKFKGETSYNQLPDDAEKMSFDITLDEWVDGQDLDGYDGFNLNNGFQDNSVMRDVVFKHFIRPHVPAAKACFAKLYINGMNWGLYDLVQDLDGAFIKEWWFSNDGGRWRAQRPSGGMGGMWGDGTAALNYLGNDTTDYQEYYTLKSSDMDDPWSALVVTCDKLCNTPIGQLSDSLWKYMDLDRVLWHLACENAFADDDSYIHKGKSDYSLYWEPETGRMTTQEIDGNSVLANQHLSWSPFYNADDANYPLLYRVLQVPELRQRYLAHLRTVIASSLNGTAALALTTTYRALIDTVVQNDPKKLMTYTQYTTGVTSLANNVNTRRNSLLGNSEVAQVAPTIANVEHETSGGINEAPTVGEVAHTRATVSSGNGINAVRLYWSNELPGRFQSTAMFDDGQHNDGAASDGVFGADLPGQVAGTWVRYYIEAIANNTALSASFAPAGAEHDVYVYQVAVSISPNDATVINEVMASNATTAVDENDQYEDWIELYNNSSSAVDLGGWFLTDTPFEPTKWQIPSGSALAPYEYMIIWADEDGGQGALHANFKISASGESVLLFDTDTALVDQSDLEQQETDMGFARVPNGTGPFVIQQPTFSGNNNFASVDDGASTMALRLYPNPSSTEVVLVWEGNEARQVRILDATQRIVRSGTMYPGARIDVSNYAAGAYVVSFPEGSARFVVLH